MELDITEEEKKAYITEIEKMLYAKDDNVVELGIAIIETYYISSSDMLIRVLKRLARMETLGSRAYLYTKLYNASCKISGYAPKENN